MKIRKLAQVYAVKPEHNIPMSWAEHEWVYRLHKRRNQGSKVGEGCCSMFSLQHLGNSAK